MGTKGHLIIIAAPSGTGKTTVIRRFLATHPHMTHSVSCTTRPMRPGDVDGRDYHFIDEAAFRKGIGEGAFAEWAMVHGNYYGTPKAPLDQALAADRDILLDLDVVGTLNLKKMYGDQATTIFLAPPSMEELERRLTSRGTDAPEVQAIRLTNALAELASKDQFDHQVVNDDLERACGEIEKIIGKP